MTELVYSAPEKVVRYQADINGRPVVVDVPQELIEERAGSGALDEDLLLDFVSRNLNIINAEVAHYLREASDVTNMRLGEQQLRNCRP